MVRDEQAVFTRRSAASCLTGRARLIEWFRWWHRPIRTLIATNHRVPSAEADDLTQEVFLRLLRYSDDILVENPQGYLFRIATNVVQQWRERCRVRLPHDEAGLETLEIESADEPQNAFERDCVSQQVLRAVNRLPARQRAILLLHVVDGMTYRQIAEQERLTYRIVVRDLTRAYSSLRQQCIKEDL